MDQNPDFVANGSYEKDCVEIGDLVFGVQGTC